MPEEKDISYKNLYLKISSKLMSSIFQIKKPTSLQFRSFLNMH